MRKIIQTPDPPSCLGTQPTGQTWFAFMKTSCHRLVADSLREEQCYLCCYCESEINESNSHVEHLVPRHYDPSRIYDYRNLASSCDGGSENNRHCGHKKEGKYDEDLFASPHDATAEKLFCYLTDGSIEPKNGLSGNDHTKAEYLITLLALDCPALRGRRHRHARQVIQTLGPSPSVEIIEWAKAYFIEPDHGGKLRQFHSLSRKLLT